MIIWTRIMNCLLLVKQFKTTFLIPDDFFPWSKNTGKTCKALVYLTIIIKTCTPIAIVRILTLRRAMR